MTGDTGHVCKGAEGPAGWGANFIGADLPVGLSVQPCDLGLSSQDPRTTARSCGSEVSRPQLRRGCSQSSQGWSEVPAGQADAQQVTPLRADLHRLIQRAGQLHKEHACPSAMDISPGVVGFGA